MLTLADGRTRLVALTTKPANPEAVTATEANAGVRLECRILKSDYRLSPTGSDTIPDTKLCAEGNAVAYGASNYEGSVTPFRELTPAGLADPANDVAWEALKDKGTRLWLLESEGKKHTEDFVAGDPYDLYEVITDNPQKPGDRGGYIKRVVPLGVQDAWLNKEIASGA
jgi:hypothetical protein